MSARPLAPELVRALKRLCLGKLLDAMPERLALAEERGLAVDEILLMLLTDEIQRRDRPSRSDSALTDCTASYQLMVEAGHVGARQSFTPGELAVPARLTNPASRH